MYCRSSGYKVSPPGRAVRRVRQVG
ncbi:hypothetical protein [Nocardioides sp.]